MKSEDLARVAGAHHPAGNRPAGTKGRAARGTEERGGRRLFITIDVGTVLER